MKFSEKSQKNRDRRFTSSLENPVLENPKGKEGGGSGQFGGGGGVWGNLPPPPPPPPANLLRFKFVFSPLIDSLLCFQIMTFFIFHL